MLSLSFVVLGVFNCIAVEDKTAILKHDLSEPSIQVISSVSHNYISNTSPTKIGVLFDITTSNVISSESNNDESTRQPFELAIVLDRSGSMNGKKIEQAKLAMLGIVDNMMDGDIIHIIQYDHNVELLIEGGDKASQNKMIEIINSIQPGGSTNLFGGLEKAYNVLKKSILNGKKDDILSHSRIFLFSDGLLNAGITDTKTILNTISRWNNELDVSISSFGIGYDFDRKLMTAIAEAARGDFFFIDSADSISKVIDIARKGAAALMGKNAIFSIKTTHNDTENVNIKLTNLFHRGLMDEKEYIHFNQIDIRDLRAADSKYIIIELLVDPKKVNEERINVIQWVLEYDDVLVKDRKEIIGNVDIKMVDETDDRLNGDGNINNNVKVFWELNEIHVLDKEILDDFENEKYDEALSKRKILLNNIEKLQRGPRYHTFSAESGDSTFFQINKRMIQRMEDDVVENKIKKMRRKRERGEKIGYKLKEDLLQDLGSRHQYNDDMDFFHDDL